MLKNINETSWLKYNELIPYQVDNIIGIYSNKEIYLSSEEELNRMYMNLDKLIILLNNFNWARLLEKDLKDLHLSLIYCLVFGEAILKKEDYESNYDFEFYFDVAVMKFSSSLERLAQLLNNHYNLGLNVEYQKNDIPTVTFKKVMKKIESSNAYDILYKLVQYPMFYDYLETRNKIAHSYNDFGDRQWFKLNSIDDSFIIAGEFQFEFIDLKIL